MPRDCKKIQRNLSKYIDNEIPAWEKIMVEAHIKECAFCAAEKEELEKLTEIFHQARECIPSENAEELFWERVHKARKHQLIEKVRSFFTQWDFIPVYYPATALLLLGLVMGIWFGNIYNGIPSHNRLSPSAIGYLALNRMDTIPYSSFTGVYLSGVKKIQNSKTEEQ